MIGQALAVLTTCVLGVLVVGCAITASDRYETNRQGGALFGWSALGLLALTITSLWWTLQVTA